MVVLRHLRGDADAAQFVHEVGRVTRFVCSKRDDERPVGVRLDHVERHDRLPTCLRASYGMSIAGLRTERFVPVPKCVALEQHEPSRELKTRCMLFESTSPKGAIARRGK
ncbi:hypothetical protein MCEMSEM23_00272 [Rhabdaerophilaceae bacterium]